MGASSLSLTEGSLDEPPASTMHVVFISACEKRAIRRSRSVLDSYALRAGPATWVTPITVEALAEVHAALRRGATRQTAVACYLNQGRHRLRLLWVVGARKRFGSQGHFPAGTLRLSSPPEGREGLKRLPPLLRAASLMVRAAGLMHDLGKASQRFQAKLQGKTDGADPIRHEWLSMRLLQELRRNGGRWDDAWSRVQRDPVGAGLGGIPLGERVVDGLSRCGVSTWLEAIDYLVVTHHGLFSAGGAGPVDALPCANPRHVRTASPPPDQLAPAGPMPSEPWQAYCAAVRRLGHLEAELATCDPVCWRALMTLARSALILADYTVSQHVRPEELATSDGLYANTVLAEGSSAARRLNQTLAWHLAQVGDTAAALLPRLGALAGLMPTQALEASDLASLSQQAIERIVQPSPAGSRFEWQNRAADMLSRAAGPAPTLVFNLASTGSGKTRMNLRAACVLNRDRPCRIAVALNLRSLTLQTGHALRSQLGLDAGDLAVVIGDQVAQTLFNSALADDDENPVEPDIEVDGDPPDVPSWMLGTLDGDRSRLVIGSPLLVSTVDYLVRAGEPGSQRHHLKALLRVLSSDLVLDEVDGYEPGPLAAVLRLVQLTAFAGRHVVCSSATLSQPVAEAVHQAFRSGLAMRGRLVDREEERPAGRVALIDDRLDAVVCDVKDNDASEFAGLYAQRLKAVAEALRDSPVRRLAYLQEIEQPVSVNSWQNAVVEAVQRLHATWSVEHVVEARGVRTPLRVSLGLVRVANIRTAVLTARILADRLPQSRVACYHSADLIAARFRKERALDRLLTRSQGDEHIVSDPDTLATLRSTRFADVIFIVVATPVEEVGRDHDFDWAVLDASSAQSLVQAGGRVNRHRLVDCNGQPNIAILRFNHRHCDNVEQGRGDAAAFIWPGYEPASHRTGVRTRRSVTGYDGHDLQKLLPWGENGLLTLDARVRFEVDRCPLAAADELQIRKRLDPFFGANGVFSALDWRSSLMTEGVGSPYRATRLREDDRLPMEFVLDTRGGEPELKQLIRISKPGWRQMTVEPVSVAAVLEPAHPRAWLNASPEELEAICDAAGLRRDEGLRVEMRQPGPLTATTTPPGLAFDEAFGFFFMRAGD